MSPKAIRNIVYVIKIGLFVLPVLSLLVSNAFFFPFITVKNFFFRTVVEVLFFLWVLLAVFDKNYRPRKTLLLMALTLTLVILFLSTIFGANPYRSFWSNFERMEGLVGHLHLFSYFLILSSVFKTKKDWQRFFAVMLGVSLLVCVYGLFQLSGKFAIHQGTRLDATFGNATYLAIFLVFHLALITLFFSWFKKRWQRIALAVLFFLELFVMIYTGTRGAVLGLFVGLAVFAAVFLFFGSKKYKLASGGLIAFLFLLVIVFMLVRNTTFLASNVVLSRLTHISLSETTVESRFTIWGMSWKGFQEHPFLGTGLENYNLIFNKYYEPKLWKQEAWFDRSHNVIFDWLTSSGILGILAYLSIFGTAFYMIWTGFKKKKFELAELAVLVSLFAAYFVHNFFVFDNLTSYFMFFSVLGFVQFNWLGSEKEEEQKKHKTDLALGQYLLLTFVFLLVVFSLYIINLKPILANISLLKTMSYIRQGVQIDVALEQFNGVFSYKTFGTCEAREQLAGYASQIVSAADISDSDKQKIIDRAIEEMEFQVKSASDDIRYQVFLGTLYAKAGRLEDSLKILQEAITLSPKKQQIYFVIADIYFMANENKKAFDALQIAYDLSPDNTEAARMLAIAAIAIGEVDYGEKLLIDNYKTALLTDKQLINAYAKIGNYEKVRDIWLEFIKQEPVNAQYYVSLAATYAQLHQTSEAINALEKAAELNSDFRQAADYYISELKAGRMP